MRFHWNSLSKNSNGNCFDIINVLKIVSGIRKPSRKYLNIIYAMLNYDLDGWIEKPVQLLNNKYASCNDKCIAIHIASFRSYMDYIERGIDSVPIFIIKNIYNIDKLRNNCLLEVTDNVIKINGDYNNGIKFR